MSSFKAFWAGLLAGDDAMAPFRPRVAKQLSALSALLLLPFFLLHLLQGRWLLAGAVGLSQVVLMLNARALSNQQQPLVPLPLTTLCFLVSVCLSVALQGVPGLLWSFPALFICYFLLSYRQALLYSALLTGAVTALAVVVVEPAVALRVAASLTLTVLMINVVLGVIGDQQRALMLQAITDPLTGAFNRRHLQERMEQLALQAPGRCGPDTLLAIDVDHFKSINDRHGHDVGDAVLQRMVQVLQGRKRRSDVLFRTGGEEFCLLLPQTAEADALHLAEALRRLVEESDLLPGERITVSIGVGQQTAVPQTAEWLRRADQALYEAKRSGRNRVVLARA